MINPGYDIQIAAWEALQGIEWNGQPVPIFDEIVEDGAGFPRIVLLEVAGGGDRFTKCGFGADWSQLIKVTMAWPVTSRVNKQAINDIADQILQRLVPNDGNLVVPGIAIWKTFGNVLNDANYGDGAMNYIDKNIRITYSLTEN
jgi:hypothetical protein